MCHQDKTQIFWHLVNCGTYSKKNITPFLFFLKVSPIPAGGLEVPFRSVELMKSFVSDLYEYGYTGEQVKNNEEESNDDKEIDIQITVEENATNENNKNVIEID